MNNFKEYGFEADFEGEILKEFDEFYIGWATHIVMVVELHLANGINIQININLKAELKGKTIEA